jgi:DNA-binding LacI/PurR family transcriptional regulator
LAGPLSHEDGQHFIVVFVIVYIVLATLTSHSMHAPHKIQVFADHQLEYFRNAILGVHRYANETSRLSLDYSWLPHEQEGNLRALVRRDSVRGVIAITHDERTESRLLKLPVPVINLSNAIPHPRLNVVTQDDFQAGVMAATHLLECGCRSLAFWGV